MKNYNQIRESIYNDIERERRLKIIYMCQQCPFYLEKKCSVDKCVNEVRRNVINENSKNQVSRIKRGGV